jgi:hypothetical protein
LEFRNDDRDYGATYNPALLLAPAAGRGALVGRLPRQAGRSEPGVAVALFRRLEGGGAEWLAETTTYLDGPYNRSAELAEDFVFPDLPAGGYIVERVDGGPAARVELEVRAGEVSVVTLRPTRSSNAQAGPTDTPAAEGGAPTATGGTPDGTAPSEPTPTASTPPTAPPTDSTAEAAPTP